MNRAPTLPAYEINGVAVSAAAFYATACDPRRPVAVEACAGAGKTWMLVSRIVRALLEGAEPHEILAITFTKRAAGEMRQRLQEWLLAFSQASNEKLAEELAVRGIRVDLHGKNGLNPSPSPCSKLSNLYQSMLMTGRPVQIRTFHSWFAALLRNAPLKVLEQLQLPASYELLEDDAEAKSLVWRRFYAALAEQPALLAAFEAAVLTHGRFQTEKALGVALDKRLEFSLADAQGVVDASVQPVGQLYPAFAGLAEPADLLRDEAVRQRWLAWARSLGRETNKTPQKAAAGILDAMDAPAAQALPLLRRALFVQDGDRLNANLAKFDAAQQAAIELLALCEAASQHEAWQHQQRMAQLTRLLVAEFAALKREHGWVDMNDVERAAAVLLGDAVLSGWMQQRLDANIRHLLIDEFQDTSPLQWQALSSWLSGYAGIGAGEAPSVFLVGDPKQSIYRFRRAEPQVFRAAQRFVREGLGGDVLSCDHTRRSAPEVIGMVNAVMLAAADGPNGTGNAGLASFRPHSTASQVSGRVCRLPQIARGALAKGGAADPFAWRDSLLMPQAEAEETLRTLEARQAAAWVAGQIARGVPPGKVMVLSRKRAGLAPMRDELRALGIAAQVAETNELIDTCEVLDIVALLDVLVSPLHDLSLARVLKSPLFGWTDDDLIALAVAARNTGCSWFDLLQDKELSVNCGLNVGPVFARWKAWVALLPPHDALQAIYTNGDVLSKFAVAAPAHLREAVLSNLLALPAAALQLGGGRFATPYGFVRALKAGGVESHAAVPPDAVRLLTIHGAKGLEADLVLLLDTDANPRSSDTMSVLVDWPGEAAHPRKFVFLANESRPPACAADALAQEQAARSREEINALYVALTRACKTLAVSGIEPFRAVAGSWWSRLQDLAEPVATAEILAGGARAGPAGAAGDQNTAFTLKSLPPALVKFPQSATENIANQDPDGDGSTESSRIGQAMHRLLQWGRLDAASAAVAAREFGLSTAQRDAAVAMARRILQGEGAWAWDAAQLAWQGDEVELWHDGALLRLDRLVQRRDSGQWWVLDHKSASQPQNEPALVTQLAQYRRAVQAMHGIVPGTSSAGSVRAAFLTAAGQLIELEDSSG